MRRALVLVLLWLGALAAPAAADRGPWGWPLAGPREVVRPFAPPASAYGAGHRGVDLPSAPGAAVRASGAGRVTYAGLLAGRGVVVVSHGALRTTYEPVTASVDVGQAVALGEVVGRLERGHLGCPVQACLHWGLRRGEEYLDPVRLVERGPVRLLPMDGSALGGTAGRVVLGGEAAGAGAAGARRAEPRDAGPGALESDPRTAPSTPAAHDEPSWSLRASEAPLGVAAVAALVLGVGLLARPTPRRPGPPATPSGAALVATAPSTDAVAPRPPAGPSVEPPPPPREPAPPPTAPRAGTAAASPATGDGDLARSPADVLELAVERARRRPA